MWWLAMVLFGLASFLVLADCVTAATGSYVLATLAALSNDMGDY